LKAILKEYGSALIALAVATVIFAVLFGGTSGTESAETSAGNVLSAGDIVTSLKNLVSQQTQSRLVENDGNLSFDDYRATGKIIVSYTNVSPVEGKKSPVSSHFTAVSEAGEEVTLTLCAVYDSDNARVYTQFQDGKEYLYPEQPGIYRICYEVVDALGRRQYGTLRIPVQRK
jgi:hypothetical protein